jgi:hypothetical protein
MILTSQQATVLERLRLAHWKQARSAGSDKFVLYEAEVGIDLALDAARKRGASA